MAALGFPDQSPNTTDTLSFLPAEPPTSVFDSLSVAIKQLPKSFIHIEALPNELLSTIFGYLDISPPSASRLLDEPTIDLTCAAVTNLKAGSLVSKRWRQAIIPSLYRHARFIFPSFTFKRINLVDEIMPFFDFVKKHALHKVISSLVLLIREGDLACHFNWIFRLNGCAKFWRSVFAAINPNELIIVAPPMALGGLTSCRVSFQDALDFDNPLHYLRLQKAPPSNGQGAIIATDNSIGEEGKKSIETILDAAKEFSSGSVENGSPSSQGSSQTEYSTSADAIPRATNSVLFDIQDWTAILLNEGSFIKAYSTYEFWLKRPPSILPDLLGEQQDFAEVPLISHTIREMSYISIFPMQSHFGVITDNFPRLDRIYVQLVPRNDILDDEAKMRNVDAEDLWMERNASYALLMRELFTAPPVDNYRFLQYFESGDAADRDAWDMAVEYVKRAGNGWKIAGDGVFVRDLGISAAAVEATGEEGSALSVH